jgi:hypothetical protein
MILMQYSPAGPLGRITHEAFSTLGTKFAENLVKFFLADSCLVAGGSMRTIEILGTI